MAWLGRVPNAIAAVLRLQNCTLQSLALKRGVGASPRLGTKTSNNYHSRPLNRIGIRYLTVRTIRRQCSG